MKYLMVLLSSLIITLNASAEMIVISHPESEVDRLSKKQVIDLYMGRVQHFPNGGKASTLDMPTDSDHRAKFYKGLTGKTLPQINAYWARLIFAGRATPPQPVESSQEVIATIMKDTTAIGYIDKSELVDSVKVIAHVE
ncbi:hypothetical protein ACMXYV_11285 [Neptuniibacter sp. SY11_33]|uniref:hypothetical protein n=1 Tax=Neptuniibacter sp. SY11_33 TaxID=3398215 RepID=UPI0039F599EF